VRRLLNLLYGELGLALILLAAALAVDFAWVRPQESDVLRLTTLKKQAERSVLLASQERLEWDAIQRYLATSGDNAGAWQERYRERDPLRLLEEKREAAGLKRFDIRLQEGAATPPFRRTTYFMSVYGDFENQIRFLKSLEEAAPLITVSSFVMNNEDPGAGVTLKLTVSVLTLPVEEDS
jgi:hypothetical protein